MLLLQSDSGAAALPFAIQPSGGKQRTVTASLVWSRFKGKAIPLAGLCWGASVLSGFTLKLLRAATAGIQFPSLITGPSAGFGTGPAVLAAADIPQAAAERKQQTVPASTPAALFGAVFCLPLPSPASRSSLFLTPALKV